MGGNASVETVALEGKRRGIVTASELEQKGFQAWKGEVRKALSAHDAQGLPFAGMSGDTDADKNPIWIQRKLWDVDQYQFNIVEHARNRNGEHTVILKLCRECQEVHNVVLDVPSLPDLS